MTDKLADSWNALARQNNAKFGVGNWHCDEIWADAPTDSPVRRFLDHARGPAHGAGMDRSAKLFGTYKGQRVRVVMASRFGDVGITPDLDAEVGYSERVYLCEMTDLSGEP